MDMMLPVMTGLAATEYIMAHNPTPIVIVSASVNRGELFKTYEALAAGAVDVLEKPLGDQTSGSWEKHFISTVKVVSRIRVITHPRARLNSYGKAVPIAPALPVSGETARRRRLIAIGASTGGPGAIVDVLRNLPVSINLPVLFVLHINEPFGTAFADWLDGQTDWRVRYPTDGDLVQSAAGTVVMAPPGRHMVVNHGRLRLTDDAERHSCRPSIDVLFQSVADECGAVSAGCLLTGMGKDGAAGLLAIRRAGGATVAQDEATSVVYGMPREAALLGAAERILPLGEIGGALTALSAGGRR
jgi:two-component system chemotaxis response regulator CheB